MTTVTHDEAASFVAATVGHTRMRSALDTYIQQQRTRWGDRL